VLYYERVSTCTHAPSDWIDLRQAEIEYPISKRTLWKWISEGKLASYRPFTRKVLLRRSEIDQLLEATKVNDIERIVDETMRELGVSE